MREVLSKNQQIRLETFQEIWRSAKWLDGLLMRASQLAKLEKSPMLNCVES